MLRPKKLYNFMIQSFLPVFFMTFLICLFIVLMQFLWKYVDEMVGKGLEISVLLELFSYAALTMVPMALPLSILLASLMTFGNLGEHFELLAIKSSGVSLLHTMRPLIFVVLIIAVGAFFFQNDVMPKAQVQMWTLLYSMREKSPELDIPEGSFYDQIQGYNIYVERKDRDKKLLLDVMIYDMSEGFDNAMIVRADRGKMRMTPDKKHLIFTLYDGESFENIKTNRTNTYTNIPYRRETFTQKEMIIAFDANFNRLDDDFLQRQYVGKDIEALQYSIDSIGVVVDSISDQCHDRLKTSGYFNLYAENLPSDSLARVTQLEREHEAALEIDIDSLLMGENTQRRQLYVSRALERASNYKNDYYFTSVTMAEKRAALRRHEIELQRKFTLSLACIIFFFIGAPLGAIIRKGGIGVPAVVSVILFIIYYIIDNTGYKLAREGVWPVWQGVWLSSAVLAVLGIFLTARATKDSAVLNLDLYADFFRNLFVRKRARKVEYQYLIMVPMKPEVATSRATTLITQCETFVLANPRYNYFKFWTKGYDLKGLSNLGTSLDSLVEYVRDTRDRKIVTKLAEYPFIMADWALRPFPFKFMAVMAMIFVPVGLPLYIMAMVRYKKLMRNINTVCSVSKDLLYLLSHTQVANEDNL